MCEHNRFNQRRRAPEYNEPTAVLCAKKWVRLEKRIIQSEKVFFSFVCVCATAFGVFLVRVQAKVAKIRVLVRSGIPFQ